MLTEDTSYEAMSGSTFSSRSTFLAGFFPCAFFAAGLGVLDPGGIDPELEPISALTIEGGARLVPTSELLSFGVPTRDLLSSCFSLGIACAIVHYERSVPWVANRAARVKGSGMHQDQLAQNWAAVCCHWGLLTLDEGFGCI